MIAIDLGNFNTKITLLKNGKIVFLTDKTGTRLIRTFFISNKYGIYIGKNATNFLLNNYNDCIYNYKFLKINFEKKLSLFLNEIKKINKIKKLIIGIPFYYNQKKRLQYLDACKITNINNINLINEDIAIALNYKILKNNNNNNILFLDIGDSSTKLSIVEFNNNNINILINDYLKIGGKNFTYLIYNYFSKLILKEHKYNIENNKKKSLKLYKICEETKIKLSLGLKKYEKIVDCLIDNKDYKIKITLELFNKLLNKYIIKINHLIENNLKKLNLKIITIELIGSSCRIPYLKKNIKYKINNLLNNKECITKGLSLYNAIISSNIKTKKYNITYKKCNIFLYLNKKKFKIKNITVPSIKKISFINKYNEIIIKEDKLSIFQIIIHKKFLNKRIKLFLNFTLDGFIKIYKLSYLNKNINYKIKKLKSLNKNEIENIIIENKNKNIYYQNLTNILDKQNKLESLCYSILDFLNLSKSNSKKDILKIKNLLNYDDFKNITSLNKIIEQINILKNLKKKLIEKEHKYLQIHSKLKYS